MKRILIGLALGAALAFSVGSVLPEVVPAIQATQQAVTTVTHDITPLAAPFAVALAVMFFALYVVPFIIAWARNGGVLYVRSMFGQAGATLGQSGKVTLLDIAKATGPDGNIAATAELLTQTNEILMDMPWYEGNMTAGHKGNVRTGLPDVIWRQMYQGVPASKSVRALVEDSCGMLEARAELDLDMAKLNGNSAAFRLSEARAFLEAMNQQMATTIVYGNTATNPERFMGLAPRFNAISGAANGQNVISAGGTDTDMTSIWLVVWGPETVFGIYPKGDKGGLIHQDLGEGDAFDSNNNRYRALMDRWQWKCGMHVKDWRYIVRICNIDTSDLVGQTGTQASTASTAIIKLMIRAMARIPFMGMGTPVFYASRTVKEFLSIAALDKSNAAVKIVEAANQFGAVAPGYVQKETQFFGIPIRTVDAILATETQIS